LKQRIGRRNVSKPHNELEKQEKESTVVYSFVRSIIIAVVVVVVFIVDGQH